MPPLVEGPRKYKTLRWLALLLWLGLIIGLIVPARFILKTLDGDLPTFEDLENPEYDEASIMESKGVEVISELLRDEGDTAIRPFMAHLEKRPFVVLKWAQSKDGYIGKRGMEIKLSDKYTDMLSHKWRSESDGIMVGHNTCLLYTSPSPRDRQKSRMPSSA